MPKAQRQTLRDAEIRGVEVSWFCPASLSTFQGTLHITPNSRLNVCCFWHKADMVIALSDVRYWG
jgi:hypothetical protein